MEESITLNLPQNLTDDEWSRVMEVYRQMDGWIEGQGLPCWYGQEGSSKVICASSEPSGLLLLGSIDPVLFRGWVTKLTATLGREVYDAEM